MIKTTLTSLRDPFVLVDNNVYYLYGTHAASDWEQGSDYKCYKNESGRLDGDWIRVPSVTIFPKTAIKNKWAPEVYKYSGAYYMFGTYHSSETNRRGCAVFRADSPEGPFTEISNGHITPPEWDAIDGTLYIDEEGQPWMVFVHEWISTDDNVGRMAVAKLSADLTQLVSEPKEIFRADTPAWARDRVTDGCFLHHVNGKLIMIWSNFDKDGYCVGVAKSKNGKIDGEWIQEEKLLYSKEIGGQDGGHGMLFKDLNGQTYLTLHSPNTATNEVKEHVVFIPVVEENDSLKCIVG